MADKDDESIVFAMVDANLDTNPKIRKAGSFGRQVFEFVLRRNALRGSKGHVPIGFIDPDYLADQLMIAAGDAVTGVTKAVTAKLIEIDETEGVVRIAGWHPSWGRRPKSGAERTDKWRKNKDAKSPKSPEPVTKRDECDDETSHVTVGDESDALEVEVEKKRDPETYIRARERDPRSGRIVEAVQQQCIKRCGDLKIARTPNTPPWPAMPRSDDPGRLALVDRIGELLAEFSPEESERIALNRVEVAFAKATADRDGGYFSLLGMFSPNSFAAFAHLDPKTIGRKPAQPNRTPRQGAIGSATPRTDHGTAMKTGKEVMS